MDALLKRRQMMQAGGTPPTPLPYTPVDYIETDGTAYINTGIKGNAPRSMKLNLLPVAPASGNSYVFACRKDSGNTRFSFLIITSDKKAGMAYGQGVFTSDIDVSASCDNGTFMIVQSILAAADQKIYVKQNGESSYTSKSHTQSGTITTATDIVLFGLNNYGTVSACEAGTRVKTCKIYSDKTWTTLLFDGEACYYNGEYGLWDHVTDTFKGNAAGSGAFTGPSIE